MERVDRTSYTRGKENGTRKKGGKWANRVLFVYGDCGSEFKTRQVEHITIFREKLIFVNDREIPQLFGNILYLLLKVMNQGTCALQNNLFNIYRLYIIMKQGNDGSCRAIGYWNLIAVKCHPGAVQFYLTRYTRLNDFFAFLNFFSGLI